MKLKKCFLVLAALAATLTAKAYTISYDAATDLTVAPSGVTFTAAGGSATLGIASKGAYKTLGVAGGAGANEIGTGESLAVSFGKNVYLNDITLGLLFDGTEHRDINEIASLDSGALSFQLKVIGENLTSYNNGLATVTLVSPANAAGSGVWTITNPFGNVAITGFVLSPINSAEYLASQNPNKSASDFGLSAFTATAPDAASSVALFGAALLGLGFITRRNRR